MSDDQTKLQGILDIAGQYGQMYRVKYGANKTKITVTGSNIDVNYYQDIKPWLMDGKTVSVVEDNEHLGQIISNYHQNQKNVDLRLNKGRKSLFSLLGAGFAYKCHLSPAVKLHLYKTFTCPVLRSGLSTFSLYKSHTEPLAIFQRKVLKSILRLNSTAATPAIHFLTSELPIEAKIHFDVFTLFYNVWSKPNTKIHQIVKYLLENNKKNSRTWSQYVRYLCEMYKIEDPLTLLRCDPPSKSEFNTYFKTLITTFHEKRVKK